MTMGAIARRITRVITAVVCVAVSVGVSVATLHVPTREGGGERFNPARYRSDVIADTVINHTTGVDKTQGTGTAGSPYDNKGDFPEAGYTPSDFHAPCSIWTYRDAESVWNCQVSGLQDLDTSSPHVRDVLSDYFVKLLDYGVAGFRVDAVKHMPPEDVLAIKKLVAKKSGRSMNDIWWTQEVIGDNAEAAEIQPRNYLKTGQVNEFQYAYRLKSLFSNSLAGGSLSIKDIPQNITDSGKASVFVTNWDTERNNMTLTYKDGDAYRLANAFMLAYPYGAPNVFSGYEFHDTDSGASGATATSVPDIDCSKDSGWSCTERWPDVHGMVGWHNVAGDAPLSDWQDDGDNMIAFGRGGRAFIAINNSVRTRTVTYHTALPAGEYCDVYASADCSGSVHVRFDGDATLTVPAGSAVAFHIAATPYTVRQ
ncbi:alpha amylase C-terminal domain-containing protein [Bifidobacterium adolescentis]|uniref:alpha amylase C-terminal domain-containing protein n=1 Tax=Bifidobacterium adolescentis TaxID=1680 RepID=UPI0034A2C4CB